MKEISRLEIVRTALAARIRDLSSRKRMPRGFTLSQLRLEVDVLEAEFARVGRQLEIENGRDHCGLDLTNGAG